MGKTNIPTNTDGSADLMGVYKMMFEQTENNGKMSMVEGHLPTIHRLLNQDFVQSALARGVNIKVLYTGPKPSNDSEKQMLREIGYLSQGTAVRLTQDNFSDLTNFMELEMAEVYDSGLGVTGITNHLMRRLQKEGAFIDYANARNIAESFESSLLRKRA